MYPEDRNRDFLLQERLQNIRKYLYLMTVFRHWIIRQMQHFVQGVERENIRKYGVDRRTANQYDSPCGSDYCVWMMERLPEKVHMRNC